MNMRKQLVKTLMWLTILGSFGVLIGCFLPFGNGYGGFMDEVDSSAFRNALDGGSQKMAVAFVVMWIALIVSWVVLSSFKAYQGLAVSIILLGIAVLGRCAYSVIEKEMCFQIFYHIFSEGKGIGAIMIEWSYVAMIIAGIIALGIKIYEKYNCGKEKELLRGEMQQKTVHRICPECGKRVTEDSKFCTICGFSLKQSVCPKCGTKRETDSLFCKECGERLPLFQKSENVGEISDLFSTIESETDEEGEEEINYSSVKCMKCGQVFPLEERKCPKCGWDSKIIV